MNLRSSKASEMKLQSELDAMKRDGAPTNEVRELKAKLSEQREINQ